MEIMAWIHLKDIIKVHALRTPDKIAFKDVNKSITFAELDNRTNQVANALLENYNFRKGDKITILINNCIEFVEIYIACAKAGIIAVPINFRLNSSEILFICQNSEAKLIITEEKYLEVIKSIHPTLIEKNGWSSDSIILIKQEKENSSNKSYEILLSRASQNPPTITVHDHDPWLILYTSGTTGTPKGVVRDHSSYTAFFLINAAEYSFTHFDYGLTVMPLFHVNSTFYAFVFTYLGASVYICREYGFNPEEFLQIVAQEQVTFTSLIPSHYQIIFSLDKSIANRYKRSSLTKLLTSSAPVRRKTKLKIMEFFPNADLFEAYGSTEAGLVTILRPEEQLKKLGSIGRECVGSARLQILDENKNPVPQGEIGELYSRSPMMFTEYFKLPEKTQESLTDDGYFSAGDMARMDKDGFYYLIDRKKNMIITGGENVYPSEIETVLAQHDAVMDCAVIGLPDEKWGEVVSAVIIPKDSYHGKITEKSIIKFCKEHLSSFKTPKRVIFISMDEMPRTASGKVIHRKLRERFSSLEKELIQ